MINHDSEPCFTLLTLYFNCCAHTEVDDRSCSNDIIPLNSHPFDIAEVQIIYIPSRLNTTRIIMTLRYFSTGWTQGNPYQLLSNEPTPRRKGNLLHRYALPTTLLLLLATTICLLVEVNRWQRIYSPFDDYQPL